MPAAPAWFSFWGGLPARAAHFAVPTVFFKRDGTTAIVFIRALRRIGVVAVSGIACHRTGKRPLALRHKFGRYREAIGIFVDLAVLTKRCGRLLRGFDRRFHPCVLIFAAGGHVQMYALVEVGPLLRSFLPGETFIKRSYLFTQRAEFRLVIPCAYHIIKCAPIVVDDAEIVLRLVVVHRIGHAAVIRHDVRPLVEP